MVLAQSDAADNEQSGPSPYHSLIANLAKAFQWQKQLESGEYGSLEELAQANKVDRTCGARLLRLTMPAAGIVEQIIKGHTANSFSLREPPSGVPMVWSQQFSTGKGLSFE